MPAEENLKKLNIELPKAADPVGSYLATKIIKNLLYISGQISMDSKGNLIKGKLGKDLEKINAVYGTRFDDEFADVKTKGNISLRQIAEKIEEVRAIRKVFFEVGNLSCESAYVGGIRIPKRDFLYVEFSRADMGLDHEYVKGGMTPSLSSDYSFIPIARKYRPR